MEGKKTTEEKKKEEKNRWSKERSAQFLMRFTVESGIPAAITAAAKKSKETTIEYCKKAVIMRLEKDGYLQATDSIILNRHKEKLKRMKKYIEEEENKMK